MAKSAPDKADSWMRWRAKASTGAHGGAGAGAVAAVGVAVGVAALAGHGVSAAAVALLRTLALDTCRGARLAPGRVQVRDFGRVVAAYHQIVWRQIPASVFFTFSSSFPSFSD